MSVNGAYLASDRHHVFDSPPGAGEVAFDDAGACVPCAAGAAAVDDAGAPAGAPMDGDS